MQLFLINFPGLSNTSLLNLISPQQSDALSTQYPGDPLEFETDAWFYNEQIRAAVSRGRAVAWSPDGQHLAFVAALHSPNTDLYVFDVLTGRITRLTSGPYQTADLIWSPTGRFIAHTSTSDINLGIRNGPTLIVQGLWSADTYSGGVTRLGGEDTGFLQWAAPDSALIYSDTASCGRFELRTVNAINGRSTLLWPGPFETAALDPESQALLVEVADYVPLTSLAHLCPPSEPSGLYLVPPGQPPRRLADYSSGYWSYHAWSMQPPLIWSPEVGLFFAFTPGGVVEITPDGQVTPSRAESIPIVSPSGQLWASGGSESPLRILHGDATPTNVFPSGTCNAAWRPDEGAFVFADGEHLYSASSPDFRPREIYFSSHNDLCRSRLVWVTQ